jgi:NitT/TauT family transport system ATP-binding protein
VTPAAPAQPSPIDEPLPAATVGGMAGLLEILLARGGTEDLPALAYDLMFEVDDLLPLVDGARLLGFATVDDADLHITDDGREFVLDDILTTKELFARKAAERAPLVRAINSALGASIDGNLPEGFFLDILRRGFSDEEARHQLDIAIDWGRYGELYEFDANTGQLRREQRAPESHTDPVEA